MVRAVRTDCHPGQGGFHRPGRARGIAYAAAPAAGPPTRPRHPLRAAPRRPSCPGVSVVVPAYNEALGIAATVRSLAASDYPELEIIVVDDGSTDDTAALVARLDLPQFG